MWGLGRWLRRRTLERRPLDPGLWSRTIAVFPFLDGLDDDELQRLHDLVVLFLDEKRIEGAAGLELDEAMRIVIAVQACILVLNLGLDAYKGWVEVIVYPEEFMPEHQYVDEAGVVHTSREIRTGEAWLAGPVILSWSEVTRDGSLDGVNVVIHEFAHKLDMLNGDANGFPPLHRGMSREDWTRAFTRAYEDFCRRVDAGEPTDIDPYASESPAEFFAVASEAFFEIPEAVEQAYPDVYVQLRQFYRQDPLARLQARAPVASRQDGLVRAR